MSLIEEDISAAALHRNNNIVCLEGIFTDDQVDYRLLGNLPISIFGIVTNIVNIVVFLHSDMRRSLVNLFLLAISITDLSLLIFNFFFLLFPVIALLSKSFILHDIYPIVLRFVPFFKIAFKIIKGDGNFCLSKINETSLIFSLSVV